MDRKMSAWSRAFRSFLIILSLLALPAFGEQYDVNRAADWIQSEYAKAFKGTWKLDRDRSLDYAETIQKAALLNGLDPERYLAQVAWESNFKNNIRDRKLPFHSWSYGLCGIQVDTARQFFPAIHGRDLIENYALNIYLGAMQMRRLIDQTGDLQKAEMAYNAGLNGMLKGGGRTYPGSISATLLKYESFRR
jgi:soluble lytic murein transglycosylase-like protein